MCGQSTEYFKDVHRKKGGGWWDTSKNPTPLAILWNGTRELRYKRA